MYNFICGEVVEATNGVVVLKSGDVGYELNVSANTLADCVIGEQKQLFCYLQVREDGLTLFGFSTKTEKNMFLQLISVSGVGCKVAQAILSGMEAQQLAAAIYNQDVKTLTKIKGLGKKTAERLVLELKEKVDGAIYESGVAVVNVGVDKEMANAVVVLTSLGLSPEDAQTRIEAASQLGAQTTQELVNMALKIG